MNNENQNNIKEEEMPVILQELYEDYVRTTLSGHKGWHDSYKQIVGEVESERQKLVNDVNYHLPDNFLDKLLWKNDNGIAFKGETPLKENEYIAYKKRKVFRDAVENLVKTPYESASPRKFINAFEEFTSIFERCKDDYNRQNPAGRSKLPKLIINRTASACTTHVSCIPAEADFDKVFVWFKRREIFPVLIYAKGDWLRNNLELVKMIQKEFQTKLDGKQTGYDEFYLNTFIRYIYEVKCLN
jgi:hypothetical protein